VRAGGPGPILGGGQNQCLERNHDRKREMMTSQTYIARYRRSVFGLQKCIALAIGILLFLQVDAQHKDTRKVIESSEITAFKLIPASHPL
jgi:hypothetical protein